ncbi:MAG: hypothetical protein WCI67_21005 [Chloroflexales bacterium]
MPKKPVAPAVSGLIIPPPSALAALSDVQVGLTEVLKVQFPDDAALHRAVDRLRRMRHVEPAVAFDGLQATFQSHSQGDAEYHLVGMDDDGQEPTIACTCPGGSWPWCVHRLRFRLELAELALRDPVELLERVVTQAAARYGTPEPTPAPARRMMPEATTPPARQGGEPPPPDENDRRAQRPVSQVSPAPADLQREIDELYP